jgi:hypothetical protein
MYVVSSSQDRNAHVSAPVRSSKIFKETLLLKSSKLDGLGTTAGETNVVQRHRP